MLFFLDAAIYKNLPASGVSSILYSDVAAMLVILLHNMSVVNSEEMSFKIIFTPYVKRNVSLLSEQPS